MYVYHVHARIRACLLCPSHCLSLVVYIHAHRQADMDTYITAHTRACILTCLTNAQGTGKTTFIKMLAGLLLSDEEEKGHKLIEKFKKQMDPESEHYAPDDLDKNNENMEKVPCMYLCMCMSLRISLYVSFSSCVFSCVHRHRAHPHPGERWAPGPVSMGTWM